MAGLEEFDELLSSLDTIQARKSRQVDEPEPLVYEEPSYEEPVYESSGYRAEEPVLEEEIRFDEPPPPPPPAKQGNISSYQRQSEIAPRSSSVVGSGGSCAKCGQQVSGEHIKAMGKVFHIEHFKCGVCGTHIQGAFYEHNREPHCPTCTGNLIPCAVCGRGILGEYIVTQDGRKHHKDCYGHKNCAKCGLRIEGTEVKALDRFWHPGCFSCGTCGKELHGNFVNREGRPVCQNCADKGRQACMVCRKPLSGEYVSFQGQGYHQMCFKCAKCNTNLDVNGFYAVNGKYHCSSCAPKQ